MIQNVPYLLPHVWQVQPSSLTGLSPEELAAVRVSFDGATSRFGTVDAQGAYRISGLEPAWTSTSARLSALLRVQGLGWMDSGRTVRGYPAREERDDQEDRRGCAQRHQIRRTHAIEQPA